MTDFNSGILSLDDWLKRRALSNQESGASRTYVVCGAGKVIGYYALSAGSILQSESTGRVRRNMPDPIPVILLGRLAVDRSWHGKEIGKGLLRDAVLRTISASEITGIRAILVHAISEDAKHFYKSCGFQESTVDPMTLMVTMRDAKLALGI
ncbi:MAG: GNAT family N-acetyltransferase [Elusimicrobiota bacterium]